MAELTYDYASPSAPTITLNGLTNTSLRQSAGVAAGGALDKNVVVTIGSAAASTSATGTVSIYIAVSADGGSTYTGGASGADASYTGAVPGPRGNLIHARDMDVIANSTTYKVGFSLVAVCGFMPQNYSYVILNSSAATLASGSISEEAVTIVSA